MCGLLRCRGANPSSASEELRLPSAGPILSILFNRANSHNVAVLRFLPGFCERSGQNAFTIYFFNFLSLILFSRKTERRPLFYLHHLLDRSESVGYTRKCGMSFGAVPTMQGCFETSPITLIPQKSIRSYHHHPKTKPCPKCSHTDQAGRN